MEIVSNTYLSLYGVTATSIMVRGFRKLGVEVQYYIPERLIDGYGMNMKSCSEIANQNIDLVITVDCGITSFEEIDYFMKKDIDVIVTDHHKTKETLPAAYAVIDNQRKDSTYPFPDICGAFVALKFICALYEEVGYKGNINDLKILAAIGTVTDVMPLISENKTLVKRGLSLIKESESINIKYLLKAAGKSKENLTAVDIGFYIGPLINASSRIGNVHDAVNVFISDDEEEIKECSERLVAYNKKRKSVEKDMTKEAMMYVMEHGVPNGVIVAYGEGWHKGVIGIACSRLVDKFFRPSIVLSLVDGKYTGSCRSIEGINMMEILNYAKDYILGYGGHVGAAGLSILPENLNGFMEKVNEYSERFLKDFSFHPVSSLEMEIYLDEVTLDSFELTKKLEPFGTSTNPEPIFVCKDLIVQDIRKIGKKEPKEHLSLTLTSQYSNLQIKAVGFFMSDYWDVIKPKDIINLSFKLNKNSFMGRDSIQMLVEDMFFDIPNPQTFKEFEEANVFNYINKNRENIKINGKLCLAIYKALREIISKDVYNTVVMDKRFLNLLISHLLNIKINYDVLMIILEILCDSGFIYYEDIGYNNLALAINNKPEEKIKISETKIAKALMS